MFATAGGSYGTRADTRPRLRRAATAPNVSVEAIKTSVTSNPSVTKMSTAPALHPPKQTLHGGVMKEGAQPDPREPSPARPSATPGVANSPQMHFDLLRTLSPDLRAPAVGFRFEQQRALSREQLLTPASQLDSPLNAMPVWITAPFTAEYLSQPLDRNAFPTLIELSSFLKKDAIFRGENKVLRIDNLPASEYEDLYLLLEPNLEQSRIKINYQDTSLVMSRPSPTHESGVLGWQYLTTLLNSELDVETDVKELITWNKGQPDTKLPALSPGGLRIKCPDASLGSSESDIPTLVLETGYSERPTGLHDDARTWLSRLVANRMAAVEEHAVQCVILFKINENLEKIWLPAFQCAIAQNPTWDPQLAPSCPTFLSRQAMQSVAMTVEVWRNEADGKGLKRTRSVRERATSSIPVAISVQNITTSDLFTSWIWEYLASVRDGTTSRFQAPSNSPPIPRSSVSEPSTPQSYFTLYLDDLISPDEIPSDKRGTIWANIPVKMWVWAYFRQAKVGTRSWGYRRDRWKRGQPAAANKENVEPTGSEVGRRVLEEVEVDERGVKRRKL